MQFRISFSTQFTSKFKHLSKRHRSLLSDFTSLKNSLLENPFQGTELSPGIRKIRMAISSKGRGRSGGVRIITATAIISEEEGRIGFLSIYDKADFSSVNQEVIKQIARELGFQV